MNGKAFIRMMREDIETHKNKAVLSSVVDVMEYVINQHPDCEIDPHKNAEDCYTAIFEEVRVNTAQKEGTTYCCSTPSMSIEAVSKYLGLMKRTDKEQPKAVPTATAGGGEIALEDFL
ncbi:MAG: hypothetical protein IJX91_04530 [Clostridia bacterium]|nr:hypothetical protein [Clostridia bacterium]